MIDSNLKNPSIKSVDNYDLYYEGVINFTAQKVRDTRDKQLQILKNAANESQDKGNSFF